MNSARALAGVMLAATATLALAGCGTSSPAPAARPAAATPTSPAAARPTANPSSDPTSNPTVNPTGNPTANPTGNPAANPATGSTVIPARPVGGAPKAGAVDPAVCPVTADTLFTALHANADMHERAGSPAALEKPACAQGFATAHTRPDGRMQPSTVVFAYLSATHRWVALNLGTADYCTGFVPDAVAEQLGTC
nr:hypothetical protein GCM10020063_030170 [Dactylosporangium thailandense]